jgi:hypothetical protein
MLAMLILCLAAGIITYYQIFKQGVFSALIMAILSIVSAIVAFNYFEILSSYLQDLGLGTYGPQAVCLVGLFMICLLILRLLTDQLIKGNMNFPLLIDRIGSGVFGLITALIVTGMIAIGFQLLPVPPSLIGFSRCPDLENPANESSLFPKGDNLVVGLIDLVSEYGFSGQNNFNHIHSNFLGDLYLNRLVLDPGSRREAGVESISLRESWVVNNTVIDVKTNEILSPDAGETFIGVRLTISGGDDKKKGAADGDGKVRFSMGQIRLAGYDENAAGQAGISAYPVGISYPGGITAEKLAINEGRLVSSGNATVDLLFSWPANLKKYPPKFVQFKRTAQAGMPSLTKIENAQPYAENLWDYVRRSSSFSSDLEKPATAAPDITCKKLAVVPDKNSQPVAAMMIPTETMMTENKAEITGKESMEKDSSGYRNLHIMLPSKTGSKEKDASPLFVPEGYTLVYLELNLSSSGLSTAVNVNLLPTLVDTYNREYTNVGFVFTGSVDKDSFVEFAYTVQDDSGELLAPKKTREKPFPDKSFLQEKAARISSGVLFYLIPSDDQIGLLGCRTRVNRVDSGEFWSLEYGIDVIPIPAP